MTRLNFRIARVLVKLRAKRRRKPMERFRTMNLRGDDDRAFGPGWFDSSWDLDQGLEVDLSGPGDPAFLAWIESLAAKPAPAPTAPVRGAPHKVEPVAPAAQAREADDWNRIEFKMDDDPVWSLPVPRTKPLPAGNLIELNLVPLDPAGRAVPLEELELTLV